MLEITEPTNPQIEYQIIASESDLTRALTELMRQPAIGVDTETTGLDPYLSRLRLIQLATPARAYIIDLFQTPHLGDALKQLFATAIPRKVFHNAKFDLKMLKYHLGIEVNSIFDTMIASQLISGGREGENHSLASATQKYINTNLDKTEQRSDWGGELTENQLVYAANDALIVLKLYEEQLKRLHTLGLLETAELEFESIASIAEMELAGILLNADRWRAIVKEIEAKHVEMASKLRQMLEPGALQMSLFGESKINLDSPAQILDTLKRLGVPVQGTRSVHLYPFAREFPVVEQLLEYRSLQKALTSYGEGMLKFIHPKTGRIHADFRQIGTPTGRLSCHDPNIQQIPSSADYRSCFVAPTDRKLIIADYSQIELRILADWSGDKVLMDAFHSGADLHRVTASQMFGLPFEAVTPELRAAAKGLNYGIVYGMGAQGLSMRIQSPLKEAEQLIDRYFATYNGVARWLRSAGETAINKGQCRTRLGRLMVIDFDREDHSSVAAAVRLGKNMPIQGTSADITKRAMMLVHRAFAGSSARMVNNIHDEFVIEADACEAETIAERLRAEMVKAGAEFIRNIPVIVDVKISDAWLK